MTNPTWVDSAEFGTLGTTDITQYGRDEAGWTINRGATSPPQTGFIAGVGSLSWTLANTDRRFDPNYASGAYFPDIHPNVDISKTATFGGTAYPMIWATIDEWPQSYPSAGIDQVSSVTAYDAVRSFSEASQVTLTRPMERTGERIQAILDAMGWSIPTDVDVGTAIVLPIKRSEGSVSGWSHISDCVNAELGDLYFEADSTLVFRDKQRIFTESRGMTSQATFSDTSSLRYSDITMLDVPIVNDVTVTYGVHGRSVRSTDSASIDAYRNRSIAVTTNLAGRSAALHLANWLVFRFKDPVSVPLSITIKPGANPNIYFPQVLGRKLCDMVTVIRTPKVNGVASAAVSTKCWIRGISHAYANHVWESTTFYLQDASWLDGLFILGTSNIGSSDVLVR